MGSLRSPVALLILAAALLLGACGGDDGAKTQEGVTRPAYLAEVNALCRKVALQSKPRDRKLQALIDGSGSYSDRLRKGAPLLREFHEVQSAKLASMKRIEPPAEDRAQVKRITAAADSALKTLGDTLDEAQRGDLAGFIDTIFDATGKRAEAERLGETYGFRKDCFGLPVKFD